MSNENNSLNKPRRSRSFSLTTYLTKSQVAEVLRRHDKQIRAYAYIEHDKDINEDLTPKERHIHLLLQLVNANTLDAVRKWFKGFVDAENKEINTLGQIMHDASASFDYLTHDTEQAKADGKYQYNTEDIITNDKSFWENSSDYSEDNITLALQELCQGVPLFEVATKYGRDFIIHYQSIKMLFNDIQTMTGGKTI